MDTNREKIKNLITDLKKEQYIPQFCHNLKSKDDVVYYSGPLFEDEELVEAIHTLLLGKWFVSGERVVKFEKEFSDYIEQKHSLMVNSGSSANLIMISALKKYLNWRDGDEIIISVVGFPTTLNPIIQNNLKPVFLDIELETLNFDIKNITDYITDKTRAIIVSPVLGNPPNMDDLLDVCFKKNICLIMDGCDSLGSKWDGKHLSSLGIVSSCSFYPAHHITTGEGGMISTDNDDLYKLCKSFSWWGRDCHCVGPANLLKNGSCNCRFSKWIPELNFNIDHKYFYTNIGYNVKPLDLQGAIGSVQLKKMDYIHKKRIENKDKIQNILTKIKGLSFPIKFEKSDVSWFGVPVICETGEIKRKFVNYLEENNIQTRNYFAGNILLHPAYKNFGNWKKYPNANVVLDRVFFLGCSPTINDNHIDYINKIVSKYE